MNTPSSNPEDFDYFYIAYQCPGVIGSSVIPQHKVEGGGVNPNGMNVASAHKYLFDLLGLPVIIVFWQQITAQRRDEFGKFQKTVAEKMYENQKVSEGVRKGHLVLLKDEKP